VQAKDVESQICPDDGSTIGRPYTVSTLPLTFTHLANKLERSTTWQPKEPPTSSPQFDLVWGGFNEGLAAVRIGDDRTGKWGYISR
jgi:hypothetical protein